MNLCGGEKTVMLNFFIIPVVRTLTNTQKNLSGTRKYLTDTIRRYVYYSQVVPTDIFRINRISSNMISSRIRDELITGIASSLHPEFSHHPQACPNFYGQSLEFFQLHLASQTIEMTNHLAFHGRLFHANSVFPQSLRREASSRPGIFFQPAKRFHQPKRTQMKRH